MFSLINREQEKVFKCSLPCLEWFARALNFDPECISQFYVVHVLKVIEGRR